MPEHMPRIVNLETRDYWIVKRTAEEKGLGLKGFSAALRIIIREWEAAQKAAPAVESEPACPFLRPPA